MHTLAVEKKIYRAFRRSLPNSPSRRHPTTPSRLLLLPLSLSLTLSLAPSAFPQTALKGRVTDWNWNNVPYAACKLVNAKLSTKTRMDGFFDFANAQPVLHATPSVIPEPPFSLHGTLLRFSIAERSSPVTIELFSLNGKCLGRIGEHRYNQGDHSIDLASHLPSASFTLTRITINSTTTVFRLFSPSPRHAITPPPPRHSITPPPRHLFTPDTLIITHFGYKPKVVPITTYDTQLDTLQLEYEYRQPGDPKGMTRIPGGLFKMGSTKNGTETPIHDVFVSPYFMDTTEVTQKDYEELMKKRPWDGYKGTEKTLITANAPAMFYTWGDAVLYCNARSKRDGKDTVYTYTSISGTAGDSSILNGVNIDYTKKGYRLPTEAEWEFACRGGTRTDYYWGTSFDTAIVNQYEWHGKNSGRVMHEAARKGPNPLRLYDMAGNAFEMCNDYITFSYKDTFEIDPIGPDTSIARVLRGRYYSSNVQDLRSAIRGQAEINKRFINFSFRPVFPYRP